MQLDVVNYAELLDEANIDVITILETALCQKGIVGIKNIPAFEQKSQAYIAAARAFAALPETTKQQYTPERDAGRTEGYELGAERFKKKNGEWQIDDFKSSYYAFVPDRSENKWPVEIDIKTAYLDLGELIFGVGKKVLAKIGLNEQIGLKHQDMLGYGRMLHYHKEKNLTNENPDWCGGHFDHGVLTGLMPAYYFQEGIAVAEPTEAGLFIMPTDSSDYVKFDAADKSVLLFQVGEFGQLISNDRIRATRHKVQKAQGGIERFAFALFHSASDETVIRSQSELTRDERYQANQCSHGTITYDQWQISSYARYRAK